LPEANEPPILNHAAKSFIVSAGILVWLPPLLIAQIAPSTLAPGNRLEAGTDGSLDPVEGHLTEVSDSTLLVASGTAEPDTVALKSLGTYVPSGFKSQPRHPQEGTSHAARAQGHSLRS